MEVGDKDSTMPISGLQPSSMADVDWFGNQKVESTGQTTRTEYASISQRKLDYNEDDDSSGDVHLTADTNLRANAIPAPFLNEQSSSQSKKFPDRLRGSIHSKRGKDKPRRKRSSRESSGGRREHMHRDHTKESESSPSPVEGLTSIENRVMSLNRDAMNHLNQGNIENALEILKKAMSLIKKTSSRASRNHRDGNTRNHTSDKSLLALAVTLSNLGCLYRHTNRLSDAYENLKQAQEVESTIFGKPSTSTMLNLSAVVLAMGRVKEALRMAIGCVVALDNAAGIKKKDAKEPNEPNRDPILLITAWHNLAMAYGQQMEEAQRQPALPTMVRAYEEARNRLGENHPTTLMLKDKCLYVSSWIIQRPQSRQSDQAVVPSNPKHPPPRAPIGGRLTPLGLSSGSELTCPPTRERASQLAGSHRISRDIMRVSSDTTSSLPLLYRTQVETQEQSNSKKESVVVPDTPYEPNATPVQEISPLTALETGGGQSILSNESPNVNEFADLDQSNQGQAKIQESKMARYIRPGSADKGKQTFLRFASEEIEAMKKDEQEAIRAAEIAIHERALSLSGRSNSTSQPARAHGTREESLSATKIGATMPSLGTMSGPLSSFPPYRTTPALPSAFETETPTSQRDEDVTPKGTTTLLNAVVHKSALERIKQIEQEQEEEENYRIRMQQEAAEAERIRIFNERLEAIQKRTQYRAAYRIQCAWMTWWQEVGKARYELRLRRAAELEKQEQQRLALLEQMRLEEQRVKKPLVPLNVSICGLKWLFSTACVRYFANLDKSPIQKILLEGKREADLVRLISKIQARWRGIRARRMVSEMKERKQKEIPVRQQEELREYCAVVIQKFFRSIIARKRKEWLIRKKYAVPARKIQKWFRKWHKDHVQRGVDKQSGMIRNKAATDIQKSWKGYVARVQYLVERLREKIQACRRQESGAALLFQRISRAYLLRTKFADRWHKRNLEGYNKKIQDRVAECERERAEAAKIPRFAPLVPRTRYELEALTRAPEVRALRESEREAFHIPLFVETVAERERQDWTKKLQNPADVRWRRAAEDNVSELEVHNFTFNRAAIKIQRTFREWRRMFHNPERNHALLLMSRGFYQKKDLATRSQRLEHAAQLKNALQTTHSHTEALNDLNSIRNIKNDLTKEIESLQRNVRDYVEKEDVRSYRKRKEDEKMLRTVEEDLEKQMGYDLARLRKPFSATL